MKILLIEPDYSNKYPPLGLMKISAYHKQKGDEVTFCRGKNKDLRDKDWDRIYITTLFTFYWKKTLDTIKFYRKSIDKPEKIYVGGILATLLIDDLRNEPELEGIIISPGLLDTAGVLGDDDIIVDSIIPDYDIINPNVNKLLDYKYQVENAYIASVTKGCIRKCEFCAVKTLEPKYSGYRDIKEYIRQVDEKYGEKRNLMLMDNNILASKSLVQIVDDLVEMGFERGNKNYKKVSGKRVLHLTKYIDFNQGTDARLLTEDTMKQLARLEIKPLRIAFDHADEVNVRIYKAAQRMAAKNNVKILSNYILFNFEDTPYDLYYRFRINIDLNEEFRSQNLNTTIWSFPMKYMPIKGAHCTDRKYISKNWNAKLLRGIQCVLNATHGVVGPKKAFFEHAFGETYEDFIAILYMPEHLILRRKENEENGNIDKWRQLYFDLNQEEMELFIKLISNNIYSQIDIENKKVLELYKYYFK
jgi:hypothetical protein